VIYLSQLLGRDAFELESATKVGTVDGIALDNHHITIVSASGTKISRSAIKAFDGDVLAFHDSASNVGDGSSVPSDPRGARVIDVNGDGLGFIEDMTVATDGAIEAILLATHEVIDGNRLLTIGSYAAIVAAESPR
jgi:sporulation protein YlmC with PRC-barrel domain